MDEGRAVPVDERARAPRLTALRACRRLVPLQEDAAAGLFDAIHYPGVGHTYISSYVSISVPVHNHSLARSACAYLSNRALPSILHTHFFSLPPSLPLFLSSSVPPSSPPSPPLPPKTPRSPISWLPGQSAWNTCTAQTHNKSGPSSFPFYSKALFIVIVRIEQLSLISSKLLVPGSLVKPTTVDKHLVRRPEDHQ